MILWEKLYFLVAVEADNNCFTLCSHNYDDMMIWRMTFSRIVSLTLKKSHQKKIYLILCWKKLTPDVYFII